MREESFSGGLPEDVTLSSLSDWVEGGAIELGGRVSSALTSNLAMVPLSPDRLCGR